ncbi:hypothetical protein DESPIG_00982 [Desulfovibrio piger ATCC 29098]|uniref:Uncharacterized protein n=1 Tax=Desulfovibrio piger ATCC 29098 TaxID=411464 RepID=B6WSJ2_9BACT|nr:hypothetical protein DESPIG_00982 [Desulfovibrio piger ATCC 29098]
MGATPPEQLREVARKFHGSAHGGDPFPGPQYQQTSPARQWPAIPVHKQGIAFQTDMAHQGRIGGHSPHPGIED